MCGAHTATTTSTLTTEIYRYKNTKLELNREATHVIAV